MEPFIRVIGCAAPLPAANLDTDVIMPKQYLKGVDRSGLREGLFHDLRFDGLGNAHDEFILNKPDWQNAKFLVVGPNFGCGSSREHAVWGLMQNGIRALIGTTFAGIFADNCARNGLLTISVSEDEWKVLVARANSALQMIVDLELQIVAGDDYEFRFDINQNLRRSIIDGLDAVGQTLTQKDLIAAFQSRHLMENPWLV